jgi:MbtH protein
MCRFGEMLATRQRKQTAMTEDRTIYRVVINPEEQYSIWPAYRDNPLGWRDADMSGTKSECLEFIERVWTDMRPLSLRQHMDRRAAASVVDQG